MEKHSLLGDRYLVRYIRVGGGKIPQVDPDLEKKKQFLLAAATRTDTDGVATVDPKAKTVIEGLIKQLYLSRYPRGKKLGCLVAFYAVWDEEKKAWRTPVPEVDPKASRVFHIGYSLCAPMDDFNKKSAVEKADQKALALPKRFSLKGKSVVHYLQYGREVVVDRTSPKSAKEIFRLLPGQIAKALKGFVVAVEKYFPDEKIPLWVTQALELEEEFDLDHVRGRISDILLAKYTAAIPLPARQIEEKIDAARLELQKLEAAYDSLVRPLGDMPELWSLGTPYIETTGLGAVAPSSMMGAAPSLIDENKWARLVFLS